jgi:uncharacterized protein (DUF1778 family)
MTRTALLIRCNADEADRIRFEAQREHRTISDYVLGISIRSVEADAAYYPNELKRRSSTVSGERTAILVRCDVTQAERIREAARRRDIPINAFILQALKSDRQTPLRVGATGVPAPTPMPGD